MAKTRNTTAAWIESAGRWQINVTNEDGKRKTFVCSTPGRKGQTDCNRKADEWLKGSVASTGDRCGKLLDMWLEHVRITTGYSNYHQRKDLTERFIRPAIGCMRLSKVTRADLQDIINREYAAGGSKKYLENIRGSISNFLGYFNMSFSIVIPTDAPKKEKRILYPDALGTLLTVDTTIRRGKLALEWYVNAWRFAAVTGLRPGEIVAYEWPCAEGDMIRVRGSLNSFQIKTDGKNKNAIRDEPMTAIARSILDAQRAQLKSAGIVCPNVFPAPDGNTAKQQSLAAHWKSYQARNGIPHISPYELRHTYVSITSGRGDLTLAELKTVLGHSKNMDTLGVYSHALPDEMQRLAIKLDAAFDGLKK